MKTASITWRRGSCSTIALAGRCLRHVAISRVLVVMQPKAAAIRVVFAGTRSASVHGLNVAPDIEMPRTNRPDPQTKRSMLEEASYTTSQRFYFRADENV